MTTGQTTLNTKFRVKNARDYSVEYSKIEHRKVKKDNSFVNRDLQLSEVKCNALIKADQSSLLNYPMTSDISFLHELYKQKTGKDLELERSHLTRSVLLSKK